MEYWVRALTADDEAIAWEMLRHAAHEPSVEAVKQQPSLVGYAAGWGREGDRGCVAMGRAEALGAAWMRVWTGSAKGYGYISDEIPELAIAVVPPYQGQGIGTTLLTQALEQMRDRVPAVSLSIRQDNAALRLYERTGFVKVPGSETVNRVGGISFTMVYTFA